MIISRINISTHTHQHVHTLCVHKFHNYVKFKGQLETEKKWWHLLYPEFESLVHVEYWSSSLTLRMQNFSSIPTEQRGAFSGPIRMLLQEMFGDRYAHQDGGGAISVFIEKTMVQRFLCSMTT